MEILQYSWIIVIVLAILKAMAEGFLLIAEKTENATDNKVAKVFAKVVKFVGVVCDFFGLGGNSKRSPLRL